MRARGHVIAVHTAKCPLHPAITCACDELGLDHDRCASAAAAHERAAQATRGVNSAVATGAGNPSTHFPPEPSGGSEEKLLAEISGRLERCAADRAVYDAEAAAVRDFAGGRNIPAGTFGGPLGGGMTSEKLKPENLEAANV